MLAALLFLLLLFPFDRPGRIHRLRCGLNVGCRQLPGLLAVQLEDSGMRHRLDKQIRQSPDERVELYPANNPLWRGQNRW